MTRRNLAILTTLTAALGLAPVAGAQCVGPDNLDVGTCCGTATPNLPIWTQGFEQGLGVCWDNCAPAVQNDLLVSWIPPQPTGCASYVASLDVADGGTGAPLLSGKMTLDYSRTWTEVDPAGNTVQVWRFLVKADMASTTLAGPACPIPDCLQPLGSQPTAFFYGYLDYAANCGSPAISYRHALVLFHGCDFLIHKPGLSSAGGAFHPTRSYAIIAPHSTAQPFVPANLPQSGGGLAFEGFRGVATAAGTVGCQVEDRLSGGAIQPFAQGCLCPLSTFPAQNTLSFASGKGSCPNPVGQVNDFQSLNVAFPILPWPFMVTTSIGRWSNAAIYPGQEAAWVNEGLFRTFDACANVDYFEVKYGSTTEAGWPAFAFPGGPLQTRLFDLVDNWTAPIGGPHPLPIMGNVMPTDHLVYSNLQ